MATVVRDGKMSAPTQGGLFQGKIFWLSLGVPTRSTIVDLIKMNGGSLVSNEKDADICIVDHMKKGSPEGMYSYEYITRSVITGKLEELERHRVLPKGRPTASGPSKLRGHTFFSQQDDDILLSTISEPGIKLFGNSIYKTLAEKYPHHTMHSWRGRWVDHFSKLMPNGPVPPRKKNTEQQETDQEENDVRKEKDVKQIRAKGERGLFTKGDEDMLEKLADRLRATNKSDIYEMLSNLNPKHTPDQWHAHFNEVILPRINLGKGPKESAAKPNQAPKESGGRYRDSNNEEPTAASNRDSPSLKAKREVNTKSEPSTSPPAPKPRKEPPTPSIHSPIRIVDVRNRPNGAPHSTRKDMTKPHQRRKTISSSPSHQPATPTGKVASIVSIKPSLPMTTPSRTKIQTPANHIPRWRAEVHRTPATEDEGASPILPKPLSHLSLTNQKRKRGSGSSPELRKKSRGVHENTSTESGSPPQSRLLSPELLGSDAHHLTSSPPLSTPKKKLNYAELSTQAIYDQIDDDPSMEFPEIEIPNTPPTPVQSTPRSQTQRKPSTPTKLPSLTPGSTPKLPLSPTKNDPDGIREMNSFLAYCQKEFGASEKQVIHAIERASGIKQLVKLVLQSIVDDKPLPTHVPGVWSEEDDKVLMGADSREMKKLQERKGAAHMERRMEFLNLWNMA